MKRVSAKVMSELFTGYRVVLFLFLCSSSLLYGAKVDSTEVHDSRDSTSPSLPRLALVGGLSAGSFVVGHVVLTNLWWKGEQSSFHFNWQDDWNYALGGDKFGHAITPYIATDLYRQAFEWTGMGTKESVWWAGGIISLYTTYVEVRDGFSEEWGFSWGDFVANNLGVGWRVAEVYEPWLNNVRWKISYWPSKAFKSGAYGSIVDDYESTYHWASLNVNAVLPESWQEMVARLF